MAKFLGLNTVDRVRAPFTLVDSDLVKRDLMNEFYTKKGERVMRPNHGSIIWDLLMDPASPELEQQIKDDVERIVSHDPRVKLIDTVVFMLENVIRVDIVLEFKPNLAQDTLYLTFIRDSVEAQ